MNLRANEIGSKHYWTTTAHVAVRPSVLVTVNPDNNNKSTEFLCTIVHCIFMCNKYPGCKIMYL